MVLVDHRANPMEGTDIYSLNGVGFDMLRNRS